ncbi:DUF5615 family PIN-like protein [bacterium]|nr:DUF5615 family PIN-like protein [bacterium]
MKILVKEKIPSMTVTTLRECGHDVTDIRGTTLQGLNDDEFWQLARREQRLFFTTDKGFTLHRPEAHAGLIIIRLRKPNRLGIHQRVIKALATHKEDEWFGTTVVMRDSVQSVWRSTDLKRMLCPVLHVLIMESS